MDRVSGKLTIYFEDPFWVGVFERIENRKLSVAKVTFGVEPKDYDVLEFINWNYYHLHFAPIVNWGKYREENGRLMMPVSVRLNHVIADGFLVANVYRLLEKGNGGILQ